MNSAAAPPPTIRHEAALTQSAESETLDASPAFLAGGGAMGALMRAADWSQSPLGPPERWPASLRTVVGLMLASRFPMFVAWGPRLAFLYNDGYAPILGAKHPRALGQPFQDIWDEIWPDILPLVDRALAGEATWSENLHLVMERHGYPEDTWYTFSYSPVRDETGAIAGMFCACTETTGQILADRQRAAAEAALRESEARFRNMADHAPVMVWTTDPGGHCTYLNRRWYEFTGQAPAAGEGFGWLDALHPEDRPHAEASFRAADRARQPFQSDYRLRRADGSYAFVLDAAAPRFGEDGEYLGYIGSVLDISERHAATGAVAESEARFRALVEASAQIVWTTDASGAVRADSPSWRAFTGQSVEDWIGFGWLDVVHPEDRARAEATWRDSVARRIAYEVEYRLRHHAGGWRWTLARGVPLLDAEGHLRSWVGMNIDIEEQRQAEAALHALNAQLEGRVEERTRERDRIWLLSQDLMLVARFDGRVMAVNPAWSQMLGWPAEELLGTNFPDLVHPEDQEATLRECSRLANGLATLRFENRYRHHDGSWRWISWTAVPAEGMIHAVGRDVTAERSAAAALHAAEEQLRQAQKMEAVGQLTGGIAHDFNNLLTGIIGSLALLKKRVAEGRAGEAGRYIDAATQSAQRAAALTQRLLAFARRQPLDPRAVDVGVLVRSMEELLRRTIGEAIRLSISIAPGLPPTLCDPNQLESAILNLAINARDAMPGGGSLTIKAAPVRLDAAAEVEPGEYVALTVTDTGTGMPPAVMARAFDPFFTTKPTGQGTGLGLSMIYGFVRQSGGSIDIRSAPGEGTAVQLCLPRHAGGAMPARPAPVPGLAGAPSAALGETVLVVEDEPVVRAVMVEVLRDLGYQALEAGDGREALALLAEGRRLDLLVTDVGLPGGMNGRQLAEQAREARPGLKVLFVTGYADAAGLTGEVLAPGTALVTKPFEAGLLARRIRGLIEG
ncbi:PAS domain S-box protein [Belnapia sp. T6]|uniref:histidine kinase n=1 Tax=Belnapia mucosa TaxID=2804532 RepID=A0ABS1V023_9PROT|nr:PAS domain-containing sensor histidine kinase [Belnapia mucosa]MBL6455053.1 PAS domain S-box protein [Belnapia mucosa]